MRLAQQLIAFALKQVLGGAADMVPDFLEERFTDHAAALPQALAHAHDRAWDALGIALAGDGFVDQIKRFFTADADPRGLREQVRVFLQTYSFDFAGATADFRERCLAELKAARQAGRLSADHLSAAEMKQPVADFRRYTEDAGLLEGAHAVVADVARQLDGDYPHLARLLRQPTPTDPPLLAAAFAYFFRREVQTNAELARGLHFELLQILFAHQAAAFAGIGGAVVRLGEKVEGMLDGVREQLVDIKAGADRIAAEVESGLNLQSEAFEVVGDSKVGSSADKVDESVMGESATALTADQLPSGEEEVDLTEVVDASEVDLGASSATFPAAPAEPPSDQDDLNVTRPYEGKMKSIHGEEEIALSEVDLGARRQSDSSKDFFEESAALADAPMEAADEEDELAGLPSVDEDSGVVVEDTLSPAVEEEPADVEEELGAVEEEEEVAEAPPAPRAERVLRQAPPHPGPSASGARRRSATTTA